MKAVVLVWLQTLAALFGHRHALDGDVRVMRDIGQLPVSARYILLRGFWVHSENEPVMGREGFVRQCTQWQVAEVWFCCISMGATVCFFTGGRGQDC